jgi:regulator of protease activity HflC (stomatin/prohibitin superfamily)
MTTRVNPADLYEATWGEQQRERRQKMIKKGLLGTVAFGGIFIFLTVALGSWYTIDETERGVILRNGALIGTADPGLHFKMPWIDTVDTFSVTSHKQQYGDSQSNTGLSTYSRDQQPAMIRLSVTYRIPPGKVSDVYKNYYNVDNLVTRSLDPKVAEHVKNVFGKFNAVTAVQERDRLNLEIEQAIKTSLKDVPIEIQAFQIENIDFSANYEKSIEARMEAEVEVQRLKQNAERTKVEAEITVINANANADAIRAEAQAKADAIKMTGEAEATAIKARGDALRESKDLILLTQAEKWNGVLPTTMIPNGTVPFLNVQE